MARQDWIGPVLLAALLVVPATAGAQALETGAGGSLTGKLTDLHSSPLDGAALVLRNEGTGAEARGITRKNGSFHFSELPPGSYTLEAESGQLGRGRLEGVLVSAGHEARVQASMAFESAPAQPADLVARVPPPPSPAPSLPVTPAPILSPAPPDPLRQLALVVSRASELARETPATVATLLVQPLIEETLHGLPLSDHAFPSEPRPIPPTETPVLIAEVEIEPLDTLSLEGLSKPEPAGTASSIEPRTGLGLGGGLAVNVAAVGAVQAAMDPIGLAQPAAGHASPAQTEVDPVTPVVATIVTARELQSLPAPGRRWQDFVLDTPAAATVGGGTSESSLRGAGQQPAETTIDGASTRMAFGGQGGSGPESSGPGANGQGGSSQNGMGKAWAGGRGLQVAETAIREVQIAAGNAEADEMRTAGGRVNVETARGINGLHGQGFLFDRQNTWGAKNPFTQWVQQTAPATLITSPVFTPEPYTPPDHESVWGFGVGSQLRRDKLFWFGALDTYRRNDPGLATVKHPDDFFAQPSNDQMQVLSARLGLSGTNPVAEGLNSYSQLLTTLNGLLGPAPRTASQWVGFARIDWNAAERHRFTFEAIGGHWNAPGGGLTEVSEPYGTNSFGSSRASEEMVLARWEAFLTPNLLAVSQGSAGRTMLGAHAEAASPFEQTFLAPNLWRQLPQMVVDSRYGFTIGNPSRFGTGSYPDEHVYQGGEMVDWVHRTLLVKAGFEMSHSMDSTSLLRNQTGTYSYSSVENFASDALAFAAYGLAGQLNPTDQHNCDQTGKVWRDSTGTLHGLGYLPCYSYYSQVMGPSQWYLSTNDWAGFTTVQWQPAKRLVVSGGLRSEWEQMPPPIAALANSDLPLTAKLPNLGNDWGPRIGLALGSAETHWPVLRLGYGMYFGRTENATIETALTQTGSPKGDLNFFMRPTDNLHAGGASPFPYVLTGEPSSMVKPGAVEFAPAFHNSQVHQAVAAVEESLPGHIEVTASALLSLGRRLPVSIDTNFDPAVNPGTITYAVVDGTGAGPIKTPRITVPFYASWPSANSVTGVGGRLNPAYQQISEIMSRANSTYEAATLKVVRYGRNGVSLHLHYTYAHAMDWNPNESTTVAGSDVLDPADFSQEYGTSNLDVRHSAAAMIVVEAPWKLRGLAGQFANGWMVSGIGQYRSGLPYTMRTSGSLAKEFDRTAGTAIVALGPGMNGSGGDNRVYGVGRNTFRYPATWKADMRVAKKFNLGQMRQLELLVESFNLFNRQNVTELETTGYYLEAGTPSGGFPTLNFLTGLKTNTTEFGQPLNVNATNFYRERQIQLGVRMRF